MNYTQDDYMYNMIKFLTLNFSKGHIFTTFFAHEEDYYAYKLDNIKNGKWEVYGGMFNHEYKFEYDEDVIMLKHSNFELTSDDFETYIGTLPGSNYFSVSEYFDNTIEGKNYIYKEYEKNFILMKYCLLRTRDKKIGFAYNLNPKHGTLIEIFKDKKTNEIVAIKIAL